MSKRILGKRFMAVFMSVAIALSFMPILPGAIGAEEAYGAEVTGKCKGVSYKITDAGVLELGDPNKVETLDNPTDRPETWGTWQGDWGYEDAVQGGVNVVNARRQWAWLADDVTTQKIISIKIVGDIKVKDSLKFIFAGMPNLESVTGLEKMDVSQATNIEYMFGCSIARPNAEGRIIYEQFYSPKLTLIDGIEGWDTSNVKHLTGAFFGCLALERIDLSGWDVSNVLRMQNVFSECQSLQYVNLTNWDTGKVKAMDWMFNDCGSLIKVEGLDNLDTSQVTTTCGMFVGCTFLGEDSLSAVEGWNMSQNRNMSRMFEGCEAVTKLDLSDWETGENTSMQGMFKNAKNLQKLDLTGWDTGEVTSLQETFSGCEKLDEIKGIEKLDTADVTSLDSTFYGCAALTELDLTGWNTGEVTTMHRTFMSCNNLTKLNVSGWDTAKVTNMVELFNGLYNREKDTGVTSLDLTGWDTGNVTTMGSLFCNNDKLKSVVGLENFDTAKVKDIGWMFCGCKELGATEMFEIDTSAVENARSMLLRTPALVSAIQAMIESGDYTADEVVELEKVKAAVEAFQRDGANEEKALQLMDEITKSYANAVIAKQKADAETKLQAAIDALADAQANPTDAAKRKAAEEALQAVHQAADRVSKLAKNTGKRAEITVADDLQKRVSEGPEAAMAQQVTTELRNAISEVENTNTEGKSAASTRVLQKALDKAKAVLADETTDAAAKSKALKELQEALSGLRNKTAAERNYDTAKAEADAAKTEHDAAKAAYEEANKTAEASKLVAEELAKTKSGSKEAVDAANKAAEDIGKAISAAEALKTTAENYLQKADAAKNAADRVEDKVIGREAKATFENAESEAAKSNKILDAVKAVAEAVEKNRKEQVAKNAIAEAEQKAKAAQDAAAKAQEAQEKAEAAKRKAEELQKTNPGSEEALKAAEEANKLAQEAEAAAKDAQAKDKAAQDAAKEAQEAAKAAGNTELEAAANKVAEDYAKAGTANAVNAITNTVTKLVTETKTIYDQVKQNHQDNNTMITVNFVAGTGGTVTTKSVVVSKGAKVGVTPAAKAKTGYKFSGTWTSSEGGSFTTAQIKDYTISGNNMTVTFTAQFTKIKIVKGKTYKVAKNSYKVTKVAAAKKKGIVTFTKAKNAKNITVPKTVKLTDGKVYTVNRVAKNAFTAKKIRKVTVGANVNRLDKNAFAKSKAKTLVVKTKKLTKARVKGSLKSSKIKTVSVKVGSKKVNRKYVKKYKKIFTKKNAGRKVVVK